MNFNYGLNELNIEISKETITINGKRFDWNGKLEKVFKYKYSINQEVIYKRYETKLKGYIKKINKKSIILIDHKNKEVKKDIKHIVQNNLYPETFFRLEHEIIGVGPFQYKKELMNQKMKDLVIERVSKLKESYYYEDYPTPQVDKDISKVWFTLTDDYKKEHTKFACSIKSRLYDWFGNDLINEFLENGFIIKEYQKGSDFKDCVYGSNQVLLLMK